jgi:glycosyltransferase involved in cell wall biosynthesis
VKSVILSDFHPDEVLGGGGAIAFEFHQILLSKGVNSEFWSTGETGKSSKTEIAFRIRQVNSPIRRYLHQIVGNSVTVRVYRTLRRDKPDFVWVHQIGNKFSYSIVPLLRLLGIPVVITLHDYLTVNTSKVGVKNPKLEFVSRRDNLLIGRRLHERLRRKILTLYVNKSNMAIAVSNLQAQILSSLGVNIFKVIPNGVAKCDHRSQIKKKGAPEQSILFAGRFHRKGLEYLVEAIKLSSLNWTLYLAGDQVLSSYASSKLPAERIIFLGKLSRSELHRFIHEMDLVCVLSQYFDPYPTVGLEAIRHGSQFITTNTSGISELLKAGGESFLFPVNTVPDLDCIVTENKDFETMRLRIDSKINTQEQVISLYLETFMKNL